MSHLEEDKNPAIADSTRWILTALTEKLEQTRKVNEQLQESNGRAIAALANKFQDDQKAELELIQANTKAISDLIGTLDKLQSGQMSMTQIMYEKQTILKEFRDIINTILQKSDRYQQETCRQIETIAKEVISLQKDFAQMQKDIIKILQELSVERHKEQNKISWLIFDLFFRLQRNPSKEVNEKWVWISGIGCEYPVVASKRNKAALTCVMRFQHRSRTLAWGWLDDLLSDLRDNSCSWKKMN